MADHTPPQSSRLVLPSTTPDDLGVYRCKAEYPADSNNAGGILYSDEAALIVLYIDMESAASTSNGNSLTITATLINDKEVFDADIFMLTFIKLSKIKMKIHE